MVTFGRARHIIPELNAMVMKAKTFSCQSINYESVYKVVHGDDREAAKEVKDKVILAHMYRVQIFLLHFPYQVNSATDWEDLLAQGYWILVKCVNEWDIEKGTYASLVTISLYQIYRTYWSQVTPISQTVLQSEARVHAFDQKCLCSTGNILNAKKAAKELQISQQTVLAARSRRTPYFVSWEEYRDKELIPDAESGSNTEEEALRSILDAEYIAAAKKILSKTPGSSVLFDYLDSDYNDFMDFAKKKGLNYQQAYRARMRAGKRLAEKGFLPKRYEKLVKGNQKSTRKVRHEKQNEKQGCNSVRT